MTDADDELHRQRLARIGFTPEQWDDMLAKELAQESHRPALARDAGTRARGARVRWRRGRAQVRRNDDEARAGTQEARCRLGRPLGVVGRRVLALPAEVLHSLTVPLPLQTEHGVAHQEKPPYAERADAEVRDIRERQEEQ